MGEGPKGLFMWIIITNEGFVHVDLRNASSLFGVGVELEIVFSEHRLDGIGGQIIFHNRIVIPQAHKHHG